jgi:hypothetical protein
MDALLSELKLLKQSSVTLDELYGAFKRAFPERLALGDGGYGSLFAWLDQMKSKGEVRFSNAGPRILKGRFSFPDTIRVNQPAKKKAASPQRQWHPLLVGEDKGASPQRRLFLEKLDTFLKQQPKGGKVVPIKARSLQIFGDEKLLGKRANLKTGYVTTNLHLSDLNCYVPDAYFLVSTQFDNDSRKVLVVENSETFHVMKERNEVSSEYRAIVYGAGNTFYKNSPYLDTLQPPNGHGQFYYFGDIDIPGLEIPMNAQSTLRRVGSEIELLPALGLYQETFDRGAAADVHYEKLHAWEKNEDCDVRAFVHQWLLRDRALAERVEALVTTHKRLAQEWIGL